MRIDTREQNREIEELMREFVSRTVDFYEHIENEAVCRPAAADSLARIEEQAIPAGGRPVEEVFREMERDIYSSTLLGQHPRSFSCVPSTMTLLSWMGDVMTSAYNPHASCKVNAPAADAVEKKLIRWMCEKAGYPEGSGGLLALRVRRLHCQSDGTDSGKRRKADMGGSREGCGLPVRADPCLCVQRAPYDRILQGAAPDPSCGRELPHGYGGAAVLGEKGPCGREDPLCSHCLRGDDEYGECGSSEGDWGCLPEI